MDSCSPYKGIGSWLIRNGETGFIVNGDDGVPLAFGSVESAWRWLNA